MSITIEELSKQVEGLKDELNFHLLNSMLFSAFIRTVIDYFVKTPEETVVFTNLFETNLKLIEKDFINESQSAQPTKTE